MSDVRCSRCGSTAPGLDRPPLPGEAGRLVHRHTCRSCWDEWKTTQVKLINEYRLNVVHPEHYERLLLEMRTWLHLRDEENGDA
jgi:Fe-S cluster biosynthesis and repair protein YggX